MRSSPILRAAAAALLSPLFVACVVPQARYDQAMEKLHREEASRRGAEAELSAAKAEVARVGQALTAREQSLSAREGEVAQFKLDADRVSTERDDAVLLVEQLRGELGRVGSNLREYSDQKRELEAALADAETRARRLDAAEQQVSLLVLLMRDVSLALGPEVAKGRAAVTVVEGKPAVRLPAADVFAAKGAELSPEVVPVLERLATTIAAHAGSRVELADLSTGDRAAEDRIARLQRVADVLVARGLGFERIGFAVAPEPTTGKAPGRAEAAPDEAAAFREGPGSVEIVIALAPSVVAEPG
jgi:hypothetical protein